MKLQRSRFAEDLLKLEEQHEAKRIETLKALEALSSTRRHALLQLQRMQILFKYLNWKQQERINSHCDGNFSPQKIHSLTASFADNSPVPVSAGPAASYLQRIKTFRKNILQFGIIQARAAEIIEALVKSTGVFNHHYRAVYRELFPLGFISRIWRSLNRFLNSPYFSWKEIGILQDLGITAGFVLKMAEAPVLGVRR